jgi:2-iminobutanoate/2-iminopropanoate deaminase
MKKAVRTDRAPAAVGPYSQAVLAGSWVFASGQIPLDPASGTLVQGGVEEQARQALTNLRAVLEAAGSGMDRVVRATVFLTDLDDFDAVNRVYAGFFPEPPPSRVCVEVSRLPRGAKVEIDAIALVGKSD